MPGKLSTSRSMKAQDKELEKMHNALIDLLDGGALFKNLPSYADNAAAIAGGLKVGQLYRTTDTLKVVH